MTTTTTTTRRKDVTVGELIDLIWSATWTHRVQRHGGRKCPQGWAPSESGSHTKSKVLCPECTELVHDLALEYLKRRASAGTADRGARAAPRARAARASSPHHHDARSPNTGRPSPHHTHTAQNTGPHTHCDHHHIPRARHTAHREFPAGCLNG